MGVVIRSNLHQMEVALVLPRHLNGRADLAFKVLFLNSNRIAGQFFHLSFVILDELESFRFVVLGEINLQLAEELAGAFVNRLRTRVLHFCVRKKPFKRGE